MRRLWRSARRMLVVSAGLALLLAFASALLVTALSRGWQREWLVHELETRLGDALGGTLRIGGLEGPLLGDFRVRDLELRAGGQPPLTVAVLDVQFELAPLLRARRLEIPSLAVEGLRLAVAEQETGWRVSGIGQTLGTASDADGTDAASFPLAALRVGRLDVRDTRARLSLLTGDEAAEGETQGRTELALRVDGIVRELHWQRGEPFRLPAALEVESKLDPSIVVGRAIERGALLATLEGKRLQVSRAALVSDAGSLSLEGGVVEFATSHWPPRPTAVHARVQVSALDLGVLSGKPELRTRLDGPVSVSFTPDPSGAATTGRLALEADLASQRFGPLAIDRVRLAGSVHTGTLVAELQEARLHGALGEVRAHGAGAPAGLEHAELRADLRVERLPAAWRGGQLLAGRLRVDATARGAWDDPRGTFALRIDDLRRGSSRGPAALRLRGEALGARRLRFDEATLTLPQAEIRSDGPAVLRLRLDAGAAPGFAIEQLTLVGPGWRARASGHASTAAAHALRLDVEAPDLGALAAVWADGLPVSGRLHGWIEADGAWTAPALRGEFVAEPLVVGTRPLERVRVEFEPDGTRQRAVIRLHDGGVEQARLELAVSRAALFGAPGTLLERPDTRARLRAESVDVAWLGGLAGSPGEDLAGVLEADVQLTGSPRAPQGAGFLRLVGGNVFVEALAGPIGPIDADLRFDGSVVRVERLHIPGAGSEGAIRGSGQLQADADATLGNTDLRVEFDDFALPLGGLVSGRLAGSLALQGAWPDLELGGRIEMRPGQFRLPEARVPGWEEIRVHGLDEGADRPAHPRSSQPRGSRAWPEALGRTRAHVTLALTGDSRVLGQGADLRIEGEVRLLKEPGEEPFYVGSIRTTEGHYRFRNRRFEIEHGTATLAGTRQLDPELDIVAVQNVGDVTLRIVVGGRASAPVVTLESDPPLDPTDQLSYLAFGRPASALGSSDAARLEAAATQVVGQILLGSGVGSGLFESLPLDRFEFEAGRGEAGTGIQVGAEVLEGVRLFYERDLGTGLEGTRIEWHFHRSWLIQSAIDEEGEAGADVIWTFEF